jgi:DNA helicase-2/ATP-dependent DNA helicase PcrA
VYSGKTYNSSEAVAEFFKNRGGRPSDTPAERPKILEAPRPEKKSSGYDKLRVMASPKPAQPAEGALVPGAYVHHEKYGRGLVLRREGSGDNAKLTVSFPGFGQNKLIEKYANLQKIN